MMFVAAKEHAKAEAKASTVMIRSRGPGSPGKLPPKGQRHRGFGVDTKEIS